eukprot:Gb_00981 [translate_table: standard]
MGVLKKPFDPNENLQDDLEIPITSLALLAQGFSKVASYFRDWNGCRKGLLDPQGTGFLAQKEFNNAWERAQSDERSWEALQEAESIEGTLHQKLIGRQKIKLLFLWKALDVQNNRKGLMEGEYSDLSVEERLNVLVSLIGVKFYVKDRCFCPALSRAVKTINKGEKVILAMKPQYGFGEKGREAIGDEVAIPPNAMFNVDLELVSWKVVDEITDDKKVLKKIFKSRRQVATHWWYLARRCHGMAFSSVLRPYSCQYSHGGVCTAIEVAPTSEPGHLYHFGVGGGVIALPPSISPSIRIVRWEEKRTFLGGAEHPTELSVGEDSF